MDVVGNDRALAFYEGATYPIPLMLVGLGIEVVTNADVATVIGDERARNVLLKAANAKRTKIVTASPFFYAYILEALTVAGLRAEAIAIIRDKWGSFIDDGATTFPELWKVTRESRCHAQSVAAANRLCFRLYRSY